MCLQFIHQLQKLSLRLGHHHLAELIEVHGPAAVLVELLQDALQLLLGEGGQQLGDEAPQGVRADEPLALLVIKPVWETWSKKTSKRGRTREIESLK